MLNRHALQPTPLGEATCDTLAAFREVMEYAFTTRTEDWLDDVLRGEKDWIAAPQEFYALFSKELKDAPGKLSSLAMPSVAGSPL